MLTKEQLKEQLSLLGVEEGMTLMVHASMKSFGYVCGGSETLIDAVLELLGYEGTLVVPLQSSDNTEPSYWQNPPIDVSLYPEVRKHHPAFHMHHSDCSNMGVFVEGVRHREGCIISSHPNAAFASVGKYARFICRKHDLSFPFAENSPLKACVDLKAHVLLLGVGFDRCTGLHYAEHLSKQRAILLQGSAMDTSEGRKWVKYLDYNHDSDDFVYIGEIMRKKNMVKEASIQTSVCQLFSLEDAVKEGVIWLSKQNVS